jgi:cytochrome P450
MVRRARLRAAAPGVCDLGRRPVDGESVMATFSPARRPSDAPQGPRGYPLVGVFPQARRDPLGFFLESARRYGDVVAMHFGTRRVYLLSHPDDVKHVLQDEHRAYGKSAPAARIRPLFGESLTTVDDEHWRRQRRLMRPLFQPKRLSFLIPAVSAATAEMLDRWQRIAACGEPVDVLSEMRWLTRAIIVRVLFGEIPAADTRALGPALDLALEHADRRLWSLSGWLAVPTPAHRRFRQAIRTVDGFVRGMIDRARGGGTSPDTLLSMLIEARDPETGMRMGDGSLRDELKALLVAGHTTMTSALGWVWYLLGEHPASRRRLQWEVGQVLASRGSGTEDRPALAYTRMLIEEVLRLYPPTWVTARTPLRDDVIRGYQIPVGSIVLLSPFVTHRHPGFWEEPHRFDPERFTAARSVGRHPFAYFPFGGGPRSCIGGWFASGVMELVVATVAQQYQLTLVANARVAAYPGLTLGPRPGVPMRLQEGTAGSTSSSGDAGPEPYRADSGCAAPDAGGDFRRCSW